jgi:predicted O-methyltransferase YrrM
MTELLEYKPLESLRSSYKKNKIGRTLAVMTLGKKPRIIVECGILDGYSLYHLAKATKSNSEALYFRGHVIAYDLFDEYEFKHGNAVDVHNMLKHEGVSDYVTILQGDAYKVHENYNDGEIDLLHVDISNDGDTFLKMFELWSPKISQFGRIVFEGGSDARDSVEWMKKYNKTPIRPAIHKLAGKKGWQIMVIKDWPSLTLIERKK